MSLTMEEAFIFDAAASALASGFRALPSAEHVVFEYLDAHPHAILNYLRDRRHVLDFLLQQNNRETREPDDDQTRDSASDTSDHVRFPDIETERYEDLCSDSSENPEELLTAEDDEEFPDGTTPEETIMPPIATLVSLSQKFMTTRIPSPGNPESKVDSIASLGGASALVDVSSRESSSAPQSISSDESDSEPESEPESEFDDEDSDMRPASPKSGAVIAFLGDDDTESENEYVDTIIPYPAPVELVEASRKEPKGKKWRLFEEESCIKHMLVIRDERQLQGEARFAEAQRRMKEIDGVDKPATHAVKNFWNRYGRARSGYDERKTKSAVLSTSQQSKHPKSKRHAPAVPPATLGKQSRRKVGNGACQPRSVIRKRKNNDDDDDSECEYRPAALVKPSTQKKRLRARA